MTSQNRNKIISSLENCSAAESDRINDRLQQCNVRILRENGNVEYSFDIRTRLQLAEALKTDATIEAVQYYFNEQWVTA